MGCWQLASTALFFLAVTAALVAGQAAAPICPLLDASGCCGSQCRVGLCAALYSFGKALGAHNTSGPLAWEIRTGWQQLYGSGPNGRDSGNANAVCASLQQQQAASQQEPFFCSDWFGVACDSTLFSNTSGCSDPAASTGISRIEIVNNNLSGNLSSAAFMDSLQLLHDCGLTQLILGGGYGELRGTMGPEWGRLYNLVGLSLFTTNLTGQLPPEIGNLTALRFLDLGANYLTGSLPESIGNLSSLRIINLGKNGFTDLGLSLGGPLPASITKLRNLEVLSLESNAFSGPLPPNMCSDMRALKAVSLRDNLFTGGISQFSRCHLQSLDLSDNRFSGSLPAPLGGTPPPWLRLMTISLAGNQLSGTLPEFPYGSAPLISIINLANNNITGRFPRSWTFLPWLSQVDLSYNNMTGTLPQELAFQSMLTSLRLHSNPHITGTISPLFRLTVSLLTLSLHNTSISGPLPGVSRAQYLSTGFDVARLCGGNQAGLGRLPTLQLATISDTHMTAQCDASRRSCDSIDEYLPWYLQADSVLWDVPLPEPGFHDNAHMKCPRIVQEEFCRLNQPPESFPITMRPIWTISPSYYHYKGCTCMGSFKPSYITKEHGSGNISVLVCSPSNSIDPELAAGISVLASVAGVLLLAYCAYVSWYGRYGLPRLQRAVANLQKRREGAPRSGKVSFVVTDIESYSELMVAMPLAMAQAVSQHSNVIRRAAWSHFGFVVGQEGDSFLLAFRDACDAVAFCLQVQQGLAKVPWPVELLQHQQQKDLAAAAPTMQQFLGAAPSGASGAAAAAGVSMDSADGVQSVSPRSLTPMGSRAQSFRGGSAAPAGFTTPFDATTAVSSAADAQASLPDALTQRNGSNGSKLWQRQQLQQQGGADAGAAADSKQAWGSLLAAKLGVGRQSSQEAGSGHSPSALLASAQDSGASLRPMPSGASKNSDALPAVDARPGSPPPYQQSQQWLAPASVLVPGLRVRMGVASGALGDKEDCTHSRVLDAAKVVSDAGCGGQVLLDSVTFAIIKDRLEELGQVGSSGYTSSSRVTGWGAPKGWLARLARRHVQLAAEAVVLDMGLYSLPGTAVKQGSDHKGLLPGLTPAACTAAQDTSAAAGRGTAQPGQAEPSAKGMLQPKDATAQGCVRLYQVLAPKCVARALLFGNVLALKRGARCHDLPYFCAPAAASRSLLDMLLMDGGPSRGRGPRSFSSIGNWAGSRLWLRHKYRLPLTSNPAGAAAAAAAASGSGRQVARLQHSQSLNLLGAQRQGSYGGKLSSQVLLPVSPPDSRAQSAIMLRQQPAQTIFEQQQHLSTSLYDAKGSAGPAAGDPLAGAAGAAGEGAATDSAHGSMRSAATNGSALPVVSIPVRGPATLWSHPGSPEGSASGGGIGGITFVFAAAVLPRQLRADNSQVAGQVSALVGTVVRQTLMALADAAAADGSGSSNAPGGAGAGGSSGSSGRVFGYMFRECAGEMKYLLAFHSPKAALEWCLLVQEALLWVDWPAAALSGGTRTADPSTQGLAPPPAGTHDATATAAASAWAAAPNGGAPAAPAAAAAASAELAVPRHVLFGGPRLKMGVASGAPQSVCPDHMGRADYHGHAVNLAARYEYVCAQPGQIVCDAALAEYVMAEWAAAAAEATAVQQELQRLSVSLLDVAAADQAAAAAENGDAGGASAAAAAAAADMQARVRQAPSSPFASPQQQGALVKEQQQQGQNGLDAAAEAAGAAATTPTAAAGAWPGALLSCGSGLDGSGVLHEEPSLSSAAGSAGLQAASNGLSCADHGGGGGSSSLASGLQSDAEFSSFALPVRPQPQQQSLTLPFAGVAAGSSGATPAAAGRAGAPAGVLGAAAAAAPGGLQSPPARVRSIPYKGPARLPSNRSSAGSTPPATPGGSWSSSLRGGSPVRTPLAAAAAGGGGGGAAGLPGPAGIRAGVPGGRASLDSRTGTPLGGFSSPGASSDDRSSSPFSFTCPAAGPGADVGPLRRAGSAGVSGSSCPGVAGLGGGFGFYGGGSSRRLTPTPARSSTAWPHDQQQQQQLPQRAAKSSKGSATRAPSAPPAPPQLLPLQPPVALPCPVAVPDGLPAFQLSVEAHRLGRYNFKGSASAIAMVEVVASHLTPRRQQLQDPALLSKGPKGGLAEPQQGLLSSVQGVQLPGLAHLYRQLYQERQAAAAAVAATAAAAAAGERGKAALGVHRFLRNSLPMQHQGQHPTGVASPRGLGSVSSSGSQSVTARLSSLVARSFSARSRGSAGAARRLSEASTDPGQQRSRATTTGGDVALTPVDTSPSRDSAGASAGGAGAEGDSPVVQ